MARRLRHGHLHFVDDAGLSDETDRRVSVDSCRCSVPIKRCLARLTPVGSVTSVAPLTGGGVWLPAPPPDWSDAEAGASAPAASRTARWPVLRQLRDASSTQPARSASQQHSVRHHLPTVNRRITV